MDPCIAILEFASIAAGIEAGDAMIKRAPLDALYTGTVHPGKYLVLVGGMVAPVEEAVDAGRLVAEDALLDVVFLPNVHPDVVGSLTGTRRTDGGEALGVVETASVAAAVRAADAGVKGASVSILELRLADDLGGKGYVLFGGVVAEVEAAVQIGTDATGAELVRSVVIAQIHDELRRNLAADPGFRSRVTSHGSEEG